MAVSDYRVKLVTSSVNLAELILSNCNLFKELGGQEAKTVLTSLIGGSKPIIQGNGKISSNVDDMILLMEQTPKIISLFQTFSPKSTLVGFKLLDNVPHKTLIDAGFQILIQNKCDFVLANDLKDIKGEQHIGYLIDKNKNYTQYTNKSEIADAIVLAVMHEKGG
jgi:phosphopantothenate-cysteine ligase